MNKRALLLKLAQDMRASYWFIPANMVLFAIVLAYGSEWLDHNAEILPFQFPESLIDTQVEGARSTLDHRDLGDRCHRRDVFHDHRRGVLRRG